MRSFHKVMALASLMLVALSVSVPTASANGPLRGTIHFIEVDSGCYLYDNYGNYRETYCLASIYFE